MPAPAVVAAEYVHEDFPPVALAAPPAPAPVAFAAQAAVPEPAPESRSAPPPLELDWSSDLVQVESDPRKMKAAQREGPPDSPAPRPKRERVPPAPLSEEPLVQIETQKRSPASEETATAP